MRGLWLSNFPAGGGEILLAREHLRFLWPTPTSPPIPGAVGGIGCRTLTQDRYLSLCIAPF